MTFKEWAEQEGLRLKESYVYCSEGSYLQVFILTATQDGPGRMSYFYNFSVDPDLAEPAHQELWPLFASLVRAGLERIVPS